MMARNDVEQIEQPATTDDPNRRSGVQEIKRPILQEAGILLLS
jgi:hypothetical protein